MSNNRGGSTTPRTVNEQAYASRRNAILDAAQQAIITKGYEQMAIADLLSELRISSGAFYHYFDCKPALLTAMVERLADQAEGAILPIVRDPDLSALDKLNRFFSTIDHMKRDNKALVLAYMRVWYADDNAIVRHKLHATRTARFAPMIQELIEQGIREGVFTAPYPDQTARMIFALLEDAGLAMSDVLLRDEHSDADLPYLERIAAATADALERVLGAPAGALRPSWSLDLSQWLPSAPVATVE